MKKSFAALSIVGQIVHIADEKGCSVKGKLHPYHYPGCNKNRDYKMNPLSNFPPGNEEEYYYRKKDNGGFFYQNSQNQKQQRDE
jgi:hypothetical protein